VIKITFLHPAHSTDAIFFPGPDMNHTLSYDLVVVGAGHAGGVAARSARDADANLSIALIGEEVHYPYERPVLSKEALREDAAPPEDDAQRYADARIDVLREHRVTSLDLAAKTLRTENGATVRYGSLVLATGSRVRTLPAPLTAHIDPAALFYLRTRDDAARLRHAMHDAKRIVIVGAGFIGLEVACAARMRGLHASVVDFAPRILSRVFPADASAVIERLHRDNGVNLLLDAAISSIRTHADGGVIVETTRGELLADIVAVGIGVAPNVELAEQAGIEVDNGIVVNAYGCTSHPGVFAAGEVTRHPSPGYALPQRHESWQVAEMQAAAAGSTAAGKPLSYEASPWFWSDQFGMNIQCLGKVETGGRIVTRGMADRAHSLFFVDNAGAVQGLIAFDSGKDISAARRLIRGNKAVDLSLLADESASWRAIMS
jgi:anthranilate 1,2-dioxygenase ferredoxin reductase component